MNSVLQPLNVLYTHRGNPIGMTHLSKSYILAFPLKTLAKRAQGVIRPETYGKMYLTHHITERTTEKTDQVLFEMGLDPRTFQIPYSYSDDGAYLHIPKKHEPRTGIPYRMVERSIVDMILYPFVKNIGLILPLEITDDNEKEVVFESQLIHPSVHLESFRRDLDYNLISVTGDGNAMDSE